MPTIPTPHTFKAVFFKASHTPNPLTSPSEALTRQQTGAPVPGLKYSLHVLECHTWRQICMGPFMY